jgi:hypothetical protein
MVKGAAQEFFRGWPHWLPALWARLELDEMLNAQFARMFV